MDDPIVEEVRRIREEHAARFGNDLEAIFNDLKNLERQSGQKVVSFSPKKVKKNHGKYPPDDSRQSSTSCTE